MNHIATQWQWQAAVFAAPPDAQVLADLQAFLRIGELAFMDDQAGIGLAFLDDAENLIERDHDARKVAEVEPQLLVLRRMINLVFANKLLLAVIGALALFGDEIRGALGTPPPRPTP